MATRLVIDGNAVYEIDEDCLECRRKRQGRREAENGGRAGQRRPAAKKERPENR